MPPLSYVVRKEQCPMCSKLGKDRTKDNLAVYSDSHKFCFSCHYAEFPNKITSFKNKQVDDEVNYALPYLPIDCDITYPQRALDWVGQYELTKEDLWKHNVMWSETMERLIFPTFKDGVLFAWQGRDFKIDSARPKWYGMGNLKETYNILGTGNKLVLTEDVISAIKVSNCGVRAMPLYGCSVGRERFQGIYNNINEDDEVILWLDPDKAKEAVKEARLGTLCGINCRTIITDKDPKEIEYANIRTLLF